MRALSRDGTPVRLIRMDARDNVAIAPVSLKKGDSVLLADASFRVRSDVDFGHKVAIRDVADGEEVVKYGVPVGRATGAIRVGEAVGVHNVVSSRFRQKRESGAKETLPGERHAARQVPRGWPATAVLAGYRRVDGRVGIRNHLLILSTVSCANRVAERIGEQVTEAVVITHACGCPQVGDDLEQTVRILEGHARHPNVGAVLLVGLGCESVPTAALTETLLSDGYTAAMVSIQECGGSDGAVARGTEWAKSLREQMASAVRRPIDVCDLVVGTECGGSDAWSGVTANPVIGSVCDRVISAGGTAFLSEVSEFIGAEHLLAARAETPDVARDILNSVSRREADASQYSVDFRGGQPTPGNIAGGLTTIEEKSMGAIAKGGTSPVRGVLGYGEPPSRRGLLIMDTPGSDIHSVTGMVAGGAQLVLFSTGRGTPTGNPIAPVIKIASNSAVFSALAGDLDMNAGTLLEGERFDAISDRLLGFVVDVCNGRLTASERLGARDIAIETLGLRL